MEKKPPMADLSDEQKVGRLKSAISILTSDMHKAARKMVSIKSPDRAAYYHNLATQLKTEIRAKREQLAELEADLREKAAKEARVKALATQLIRQLSKETPECSTKKRSIGTSAVVRLDPRDVPDLKPLQDKLDTPRGTGRRRLVSSKSGSTSRI